jgi:PAS domain S-box-containing protein
MNTQGRKRPLAFRHQLALVVTLTSGAAVSLAAFGTLSYEARRAYVDVTEESVSLARIVGANSVGPLAFSDTRAGETALRTLQITEQVEGARLYDTTGRPFATYRRAGGSTDLIPPTPAFTGHHFVAGHLVVFEPIWHDGERLGTVSLTVNPERKIAGLVRTLGMLLLCFAISTVTALFLSRGVQRRVSQPVLELAAAARRISESRDYSIRVEPGGPMELRELTLGFNAMLREIQDHEVALRAARDGLEQRVADRVRDLQHEVNERRKAEAQSRRRAQRLQLQGAALESAADAIAITDPEGMILWVNPAFCSLMSYSADEVVGRPAAMFRSGHEEDAKAYRSMISASKKGLVWEGELVAQHKDGTLGLIAQTVTPVRDGADRISHYVAVMRDVSQRRRLEDQLRQAQKMEAVGRLSGGVAHDFNNILNVIMGFGELLLRKLPADGGMRRHAVEILKATKRGAGLTRQLLAFSRQQVLQPKVIDLNAAIAETERMLERLIGEDIELVTSLDPQLGQVKVDPGQLEQVIMNLAVNARDAMPRGGTLAIDTANVELTEGEAKMYSYPVTAGAYARIVVGDTGVGMDAATLSHLFEPFFTTKPVDKGTGLGLATVYGIVKQSKGYIWVRSAVGEGTTFTILLPRVSVQAQTASAPEDPGIDPQGRETVLLVEDDEAARELWHEMLEALGYRALVAANGVEALERAAAYPGRIDVLISDVVMPRLGGRELAAQLCKGRPEVRVIFMSGYTADTILREDIAGSGGSFLQKPFSASELARQIREVLDGEVPVREPVPMNASATSAPTLSAGALALPKGV